MGPDKSNIFLGDGSFLTGAIFMSNHATKEECFSRKLFGLPSFQAEFVKKIKAGMILFLFEYEERKLYGVFEASSDGAMNIIPTAFISSGKLFSAQVCFRIMWRCRPLPEAEFRDAIKENYYAHNKFHFHLSEIQVFKLLQLFVSKLSFSKGCKFKPESGHPWKNGDKKYQKLRSGKYKANKENNSDLNMHPDLPGTNLNQFPYHKRSLQNADSTIMSMEAALHPRVSPLEQPAPLDVVNSTSRSAHAFNGNIPVSSEENSFYQLVPGLHLKNSSISSGMNNVPMKEPASYFSGSFDNHPFSRYQCYHSHPDQDVPSMSIAYQNVGISSNPQDAFYPVYESNCSLPILASEDNRERVSIINLQDSTTTRNLRNRVNITNLQNSYHRSSPGFNDHYTPDISSSNQGNYRKLHFDVTSSVHNSAGTELLGYGHCAATCQSDDNSRGPRYFRLEPREVMPCSEYGPNNLEIIESSFCSSPHKASSRILYGSGPSEYQDEATSSYCYSGDDEYDSVAISSKFHSENHERRTSVFLRLSGIQKPRAEKETCKPDLDVLLDKHIRDLSSRRKYWPKMTEIPNFKKSTKVPDFKKMKLVPSLKNVNKVSDQLVMLDFDKQLENVDQLNSQAAVPCKRKQSCNEEGTENGTILPFLNFKRRSEAQRVACGTETSNSVEVRDSEVSLVKHKRKKLLRPSFGEEHASNKVDEVQHVLGATQETFLKGNDGESNEGVDTAVGVGNETYAAAISHIAHGASQEQHMETVQVTVSEDRGNVRASPASESNVVKPMELNSEGTIFIEGKGKLLNTLESSQNLHGGPLIVVDINNSGGDECNAGGGKEVEMENLSRAPHIDNTKTDIINITSGEKYKFPDMQSSSEHFHGGSLFLKIGDSRGGEEHGDALHRNGSGSERRHEAKYSGECRSCCCNSEESSRRHVCPASASAAHEIRLGELSSNQCRSHDEATKNNQEDNISARMHFAELDCKNTTDSQSNLVNNEENLSVKAHFTESGGEITDDSPTNLFRTVVGVGQLSSGTCILYSAEAFRDTEEEKIGVEINPIFDSNDKKASHGCLARSAEGIETAGLRSNPYIIPTDESAAGMTLTLCGKRPLNEAVEVMGTGGLLSKSCTARTAKPIANTEDHVMLGRLLPKASDKDKKASSYDLVRAVECVSAESSQQGKNEERLPAELDSIHRKTSYRSPETTGSLQELSLVVDSGISGFLTDPGHGHLPISLEHTRGNGA